tara:strand:+ start:5894 stop:6403 length:510 start_codon:yes stop_codon:yes gene_type:complete
MSDINNVIPKLRDGVCFRRVLSQEQIEGKTVDELMECLEEGEYLCLLNGYEAGDSTMVANQNTLTRYAGAVIVSQGFPAQIQAIQKTKDPRDRKDEFVRFTNDVDQGLKVITDQDEYHYEGYADLVVCHYLDERDNYYENFKELHDDGFDGWSPAEYERYYELKMQEDE